MEVLDIAMAVVCYACRHIAHSLLLDWKVSVLQYVVFSESRFVLRSDQRKSTSRYVWDALKHLLLETKWLDLARRHHIVTTTVTRPYTYSQ